MTTRDRRAGFLGLAGLGLLVLAGCDKPDGTNAGLTNGPPPSATDKSAVRTDLPGSASPAIDTPTGTPGPSADMPTTGKSDAVRANPPVKGEGDPNSAGGGTKPTETIKTGTPKGPQ